MATRLWIGGASGATGDWSNTANWHDTTVPVDGDDVYIEVNNQDTMYDINAGLNQSAIDLGSLHISQGFTQTIGTSSAYLRIGTAILNVGYPTGRLNETGSERIRLELQNTSTCDAHIYDTSRVSGDVGREPLIITTANSGSGNHTFSISGGLVGLGSLEADDEFKSSWVSLTPNGPNDPSVTIGDSATATSIYIGSGEVHNQGAAMTLVEMLDGAYWAWKNCTHTTMNIYGGMCYYNSDGTITTLRVSSSGVWDTSRDARAKTVSAAQLFSGGTINARTAEPASVTWAGNIDLVECGLEDVSLDLGDHIRIQQTSI